MIGLGTYAFFWELSEETDPAAGLVSAFESTSALGVELFQICDFEAITGFGDRVLERVVGAARDAGLTIELGTRGVKADRLGDYLRLADAFDARLVRSMPLSAAAGVAPDLGEAERVLREMLPRYADAGVTIALETYEQVPTGALAGLVEEIGHDLLGICLDPGNVVANLESPRAVVERCAEITRNVHVKDFTFARQDGWVGFTYSGAAMGTGLHDYPHLRRHVRPHERGINEIVEHWLPWQGDAVRTIRMEREWTSRSLTYLRSTR